MKIILVGCWFCIVHFAGPDGHRHVIFPWWNRAVVACAVGAVRIVGLIKIYYNFIIADAPHININVAAAAITFFTAGNISKRKE